MDLATIKVNYILGLGRSGTTLLIRELGKSKHVVANPESLFILEFLYLFKPKQDLNHSEIDFFLKTIFKLKTGRFVHLELWKINKEKLSNEAKSQPTIRFIDLVKLVNLNAVNGLNTENPKTVLDKNPPYTMHFDQLKVLDKNSKFIGIFRSHLDNIISRHKFKLDAINHPYFHALIWCQYNDFLLKKSQEYPDNLKLIKYEELAQNPNRNLNTVRDFFGITSDLKNSDEIPPIENLLSELATKEERNQFFEMHGKVFTKIDTAAINKSNPFSAKQLNSIHFICAQTSEKLGYEKILFQKPSINQRILIGLFRSVLLFVEFKHKRYFKSNHSIRKFFKYVTKPWLLVINKS